MKSNSLKQTKWKNLDLSGFTKLNVNELMKIRGGDATATIDPARKLPE